LYSKLGCLKFIKKPIKAKGATILDEEKRMLFPNLRMPSIPIFKFNVSTFYLKKATMMHEVK
jgi:hypothetical protein